jgi:hypothetical protein
MDALSVHFDDDAPIARGLMGAGDNVTPRAVVRCFCNLVSVTSVSKLEIKQRERRATRVLASLGVQTLVPVLFNECSILLAWKHVIFGSYFELWEKAETTRMLALNERLFSRCQL